MGIDVKDRVMSEDEALKKRQEVRALLSGKTLSNPETDKRDIKVAKEEFTPQVNKTSKNTRILPTGEIEILDK